MFVKRLFGSIATVVLGGMFLSAAVVAGDDVLAQLGFKEAEARERVVQALGTGNVYTYPAEKAFKALAPAARVTLLSSALTWTRTYTESPDFSSRYATVRTNQKPKAPESADQKFKKMVDEQKDGIEKLKASMAAMPPDTRKQMEAAVKQNEQMLSDPKKVEMMKQICDQAAAAERQRYDADLVRWNEKYPENSRALIANRLRAFLEVSAQVDYNAELVKRGRVMAFANPDLEGRSKEWKLCYRAGKPVVDAARAVATTWLAQIGKAGQPGT